MSLLLLFRRIRRLPIRPLLDARYTVVARHRRFAAAADRRDCVVHASARSYVAIAAGVDRQASARPRSWEARW